MHKSYNVEYLFNFGFCAASNRRLKTLTKGCVPSVRCRMAAVCAQVEKGGEWANNQSVKPRGICSSWRSLSGNCYIECIDLAL